jgi:hypothetical protein
LKSTSAEETQVKKTTKDTGKPSTKTEPGSNRPKLTNKDGELSFKDLDRAAGGSTPARPREEAKK